MPRLPWGDDASAYAAAFEVWLASPPAELRAATRPIASYEERVAVTSALMRVLFDEGWARYGWPTQLGGLGGDILHRAAMWEALARHGLPAMALFEHLEVLAPTLVAMGEPGFLAEVLPQFLRGEQLWSQGFSEPESGSDLAAVRTRAVAVDGGYAITGRKIWTSWARYATWCLVLARTGTVASRHRGLTAFAVDLRSPGVEVRAIEQANGTDELAEVTFDDVLVGPGRIVGELNGGWRVAMHILSHERGTFAWFRHNFLYRQVLDALAHGEPAGDALLGDALLDLAAVRASSYAALRSHAADVLLGARATFVKLHLASSEQAVQNWRLASDADLAVGIQDDEAAAQRQDYLFSRIVTVYGGSQQMQLDTIAKQILRLP
ncbi:acyl-CoA dehydrogenase family protein [Frankia sp. AgKG'84/4]|uniref:acyl-CoA dehydrogenase family protein n=1 Tax=Frankia sp. AgKG'84/4 TaxID=573490 RepID=UPI002029C82E|nr:acyl-CoA dehydrogenase family protein [Frankia sp. AgKG'84/4]MCL9793496.1 acyl-CoA dehydrogenase family protein [Frankia sp. AgKG'84/4]